MMTGTINFVDPFAYYPKTNTQLSELLNESGLFYHYTFSAMGFVALKFEYVKTRKTIGATFIYGYTNLEVRRKIKVESKFYKCKLCSLKRFVDTLEDNALVIVKNLGLVNKHIDNLLKLKETTFTENGELNQNLLAAAVLDCFADTCAPILPKTDFTGTIQAAMKSLNIDMSVFDLSTRSIICVDGCLQTIGQISKKIFRAKTKVTDEQTLKAISAFYGTTKPPKSHIQPRYDQIFKKISQEPLTMSCLFKLHGLVLVVHENS